MNQEFQPNLISQAVKQVFFSYPKVLPQWIKGLTGLTPQWDPQPIGWYSTPQLLIPQQPSIYVTDSPCEKNPANQRKRKKLRRASRSGQNSNLDPPEWQPSVLTTMLCHIHCIWFNYFFFQLYSFAAGPPGPPGPPGE